jgi:hypothetical protein
MTTKMRMVLCLLAIAAPAGMELRAAQGESTGTTGKVLILDNERTLEGDIERIGPQYRIRRPVGELWVRADETLQLCQTREEAYAFLRARANLLDPDEHLRLARWCQLHGLCRQALEEATAAVEVRPSHVESRRLLRNLQRACEATAGVGRISNPSNVDGLEIRPTKLQEEEERSPHPQPPQLSTESLSLFLSRVQPILMNACANCHATGRGGAFKLTRTYEAGFIGRKTTQQNLAAVLAQVNKELPSASALLNKAVSIHGRPGEMGQPPLKNREVAAYRSLEEWVRVTLENTPPRRDKGSGSALVADRAHAVDATLPASPAKPETRESGIATEPPVPVEPVDPFDPLIFNRQMHPSGR